MSNNNTPALLESRKLLAAAVIVREYNANGTTPDPQTGNSGYHRFFAARWNGTGITWDNYEEAIPVGADFAQTGDFNGDGKVDILSRTGAGLTVALNLGTGSDFGAITNWGNPTINWASGWTYENDLLVGNFLGDTDGVRRDDVAWIESIAGGSRVMVAKSTGSGFAAPVVLFTGLGLEGRGFRIGNVNRQAADQRDDLVFTSTLQGEAIGTPQKWRCIRSKSGFTSTVTLVEGPSAVGSADGFNDAVLGRFDNSTGVDLAVRYFSGHQSGPTWASVNEGVWRVWSPGFDSLDPPAFATYGTWTESMPTGGASYQERYWGNIRAADFDGNGKDDLFGRDRDGRIRVSLRAGGTNLSFLNAGTSYNPLNPLVEIPFTVWDTYTTMTTNTSVPSGDDNGYQIGYQGVYVGDMTGDGKADVFWMNGASQVTELGISTGVVFNRSSQATLTSQHSNIFYTGIAKMNGKRARNSNDGFGLF